MARIVNENLFPSHGRGRGDNNYPFGEWIDGQARILTRGEDFDENSDVNEVARDIRLGISKLGYPVRVKIADNDGIIVQVKINMKKKPRE
jgi:hypothetical protein